MNHYMDEFLNELQQYILKIIGGILNGNCDYRTIVALLDNVRSLDLLFAKI